MPKYIQDQHITGELGVNEFENYCLRHNPPILFRSERVSDFGIDGEVELTAFTQEGKKYATGEIIKIQIKSTKAGSYIHKDTEESFEFHASDNDVEYWNMHNLDVILVIYDVEKDLLYAKKIDQIDAATKKTKIPIVFSKEENQLVKDSNDFTKKYSNRFKGRVDFSNSENLLLNLFKFSKLPKYLYEFKSNYTDPKEVFQKLGDAQAPLYKISGDTIYTFYDPSPYKKFCEEIIDYNSKNKESFKKKLLEEDYYRICIELINRQFTTVAYSKKIGFNRKYKRYYFMPLHKDFDEKKGKFKLRREFYSSKTERNTPKTVVNFYTYGKNSFYKHFAFETKPIIIEGSLYLIINPKYLFTSDGKVPLDDPDLITKLTNYLTSRERNQQILNHVHFIYWSLSDKTKLINICELPDSEIVLTKYISEKVNFSIPMDSKTPKNRKVSRDNFQTKLFE